MGVCRFFLSVKFATSLLASLARVYTDLILHFQTIKKLELFSKEKQKCYKNLERAVATAARVFKVSTLMGKSLNDETRLQLG